jgi:hypothetical protein
MGVERVGENRDFFVILIFYAKVLCPNSWDKGISL